MLWFKIPGFLEQGNNIPGGHSGRLSAVGAVYDRARSAYSEIVRGHRPRLQQSYRPGTGRVAHLEMGAGMVLVKKYVGIGPTPPRLRE